MTPYCYRTVTRSNIYICRSQCRSDCSGAARVQQAHLRVCRAVKVNWGHEVQVQQSEHNMQLCL